MNHAHGGHGGAHAAHGAPAPVATAGAAHDATGHHAVMANMAGMAGREGIASVPMMDGQRTTWPHFAHLVLGLWLITRVFALDNRGTGLDMSDVVSGALVIGLSLLSLSRRPLFGSWAPLANALIGVWLLFAPLVFWAPTAASYGFDTLIGALVVAFAVLAPGMPMAEGMYTGTGPDIPSGWSYDPSSWPQRAPIIALALVGFFPSRQIAAFALHHIGALPAPFFGLGTQRVLTSDVSRAFPIADAGFGTLAYMLAFLLCSLPRGPVGERHGSWEQFIR